MSLTTRHWCSSCLCFLESERHGSDLRVQGLHLRLGASLCLRPVRVGAWTRAPAAQGLLSPGTRAVVLQLGASLAGGSRLSDKARARDGIPMR